MPELPPYLAFIASDALVTTIVILGALVVGALVSRLLWLALRRWSAYSGAVDLKILPTRGLERALGVTLPLLAVAVVLPLAPIDPAVVERVQAVLAPIVVLACTWAVLAAIGTVESGVLAGWRTNEPDDLTARIVTTRIRVARNLATFLVIVVGCGVALMTVEAVRQFGTSLLASAGVAGVIIGFAAQRSIATLLAGVQIAFSQPIRIDDVVIVEGEWGRIEEITLTYVVVRIWDLRRLVVPITYFIEKPFQNWTRTSADLLAQVTFEVDYRLPVAEARAELKRILDATDLYDGELMGLQVTDCSDRTMKLRALMDAPDASRAWDLRCHVREHMLAWMQRTHPDKLPRLRVDGEQPVALAVKQLA